MSREELIKKARDKFMSSRKVICTGDPSNPKHIASGIKKVWPDATFIYKSNGYDLDTEQEKIKEQLSKHNTFINASYINSEAQVKLLELCAEAMPIGDVYNIGSSHEYDNLGPEEYKNAKLKLRDKSLSLNSFRFQTCHIIVGGIDRGREDTKGWIEPIEIAELIKWTINSRYNIPIIGIDQPKKPW